MSYERQMLTDLEMPSRQDVEGALLKSLFLHKGVIKEFGVNEEIVDAIASDFSLTDMQKNAFLETTYRKENRVKKAYLWHRLLFRAADKLAKKKYISRPTDTFKLTGKKEWMLTENGYDKVLAILSIPAEQKEKLHVKSFEVQKIANEMVGVQCPVEYTPFDTNKSVKETTREIRLRNRGFRLAVIESYDCRCAFCGLKIHTPNQLQWEVEAAHIVPRSANGRDDIWNGIAFCRLHHWAFDVGWLGIENDYSVLISDKIRHARCEIGKMFDTDIFANAYSSKHYLHLPQNSDSYPHPSSLMWHRENIFARL